MCLQDPAKDVNPEQTACILSMALYLFLDPYIWLGYRLSHLPLEKLPPLADYDYTKNLAQKSFKVCHLYRAWAESSINARSSSASRPIPDAQQEAHVLWSYEGVL